MTLSHRVRLLVNQCITLSVAIIQLRLEPACGSAKVSYACIDPHAHLRDGRWEPITVMESCDKVYMS